MSLNMGTVIYNIWSKISEGQGNVVLNTLITHNYWFHLLALLVTLFLFSEQNDGLDSYLDYQLYGERKVSWPYIFNNTIKIAWWTLQSSFCHMFFSFSGHHYWAVQKGVLWERDVLATALTNASNVNHICRRLMHGVFIPRVRQGEKRHVKRGAASHWSPGCDRVKRDMLNEELLPTDDNNRISFNVYIW